MGIEAYRKDAEGAPCRARFRAAASVAAFLLACAIGFMLPGTALGSFKDFDTTHPAEQDLGTYGEPLYASDIPEGTYVVPARTDSRMCIFYKDEADVGTSEKEWAVLYVSGGSMSVSFYTSKMYNYLYFGSAEEAAALTNEDGTDASAYIAGDPPEGYVPHYFELSVPSLNEPIAFSSFAGGNYEISNPRAKWYSHRVVFASTEEIEDAIARSQSQDEGGGGDQGGNQGPGEDQGGDEGGGTVPGDETPGGDSGGEGSTVPPTFNPDDFDLDFGGGPSGGAGGGAAGGAGSGTGSGSGSGGASSDSGAAAGTANAAAEAGASGAAGSSSATNAQSGASSGSSRSMHGVAISVVGLDDAGLPAEELPSFKTEEKKEPLIALPQAIAIATAVLAAGGIAAQVLLYRRNFDARKGA